MYKEGTFFAGEIPSDVAAWCNASFKYFLEPVEGGYILRSKGKEVLVNESITLAQYYLSATDWYAVRYAETGIPVPEDVKTKRQAASEEIDRLRTELTVIN